MSSFRRRLHLNLCTTGIGRGMLNHYMAESNNTIIAAVRDPSTSQGLLSLPKGANTKVIIVKIDSASKIDPYTAISTLQFQGISHIDVVISAAGIAKLNKATLPLLRKAEKPAKFAFISAAGGSLNDMAKYPYPNVGYAASKALANVLVRKMGMENDWLVSLCIHPG